MDYHYIQDTGFLASILWTKRLDSLFSKLLSSKIIGKLFHQEH